MPISCPQCKTKNHDDANECRKCGTLLTPPVDAGTQPPGPGKAVRKRGFLSPFALFLYRLLTVILLAALLFSQIKLFLANRALSRSTRQLEYASATIEQYVRAAGEHDLLGNGDNLPQLRVMPLDGQSLSLGLKLPACKVEEIRFEGSRVTVGIANRSLQPTQPMVRVLLYDWYGQPVGDARVVEPGDELKSGETREATAKIKVPRERPRYFSVTDKE